MASKFNPQSPYYKQVELLIKVLPIVASEPIFALKGGTAINLFVRNFPRLSVDIDLAYLPLEPRSEALINAKSALQRIADNITAQLGYIAVLQDNKTDELRVIVSNHTTNIKIEVSPVARGTLHQPTIMPIQEAVEDEFGFAEIAVVSLPDLYGGKLCAAMDRQHPRDLFDVSKLLKAEGITREIFIGFLTYVLSHPRPINEVLAPNWQTLNDKFELEFSGMTFETVTFETLLETQPEMLNSLKRQLTPQDREFLLSFKRGEPEWSLFDQPQAAELPAIRWKLQNITKLAENKNKHTEQILKLEAVLGNWLNLR